MDTLIAIPAERPGSLGCEVCMHFGHCEVFTLVDIENDAVKNVAVLENPPHSEGGCLTPVQILAERGVKVMLAGGMGLRPLMAFNQAGIRVYRVGEVENIEQAVQAFIDGQLPEFSQDQTCQHHHGGGCHSNG